MSQWGSIANRLITSSAAVAFPSRMVTLPAREVNRANDSPPATLFRFTDGGRLPTVGAACDDCCVWLES
jgi:hypothetical protein